MSTFFDTLGLLFVAYCVAGAAMALWSLCRSADPVTYRIDESAWFLLCPVWLAEHRGDLVPIPRTPFLDPWFELNVLLARGWNWLLCAVGCGDAAFFAFHHVEAVEPFQITL